MSRQLDAVYEHGVFRPLKPLAPPEHQHVRLTIEETPGSRSRMNLRRPSTGAPNWSSSPRSRRRTPVNGSHSTEIGWWLTVSHSRRSAKPPALLKLPSRSLPVSRAAICPSAAGRPSPPITAPISSEPTPARTKRCHVHSGKEPAIARSWAPRVGMCSTTIVQTSSRSIPKYSWISTFRKAMICRQGTSG